MSRVLACGLSAVVATDAVVRDVHVIEVGRYPGKRCMAVIAVVATRNVRRVLAGRRIAVMAGNAGSQYLGVVHHISWRERHVIVAVLANITRIYMVRILAGGLHAIVTIDAIGGDADVVKVGGRPGNRCMTVIAIVAAENM